MIVKAYKLAALLLLLASSLLPALAGTPLLHCATAEDFTRSFNAPGDSWQADGTGMTGVSPHYRELPGSKLDGFADDAHTFFVVHGVNLWRLAPAGQAEWQDYTLETTVRILSPAPLDGIRPGEGCVFMNYQWGREAMGSDAGICVRYQGADSYYMLRLSTGYRHLELWKCKGGVVCVKPFPFLPDTDYRLTVTARGRWITVAIDGKEIIRYFDPVQPLLTGRIALGVRESRVRFSALTVTAVLPNPAKVPAHHPRFHLREWVGRTYIFDGDEPIAHIMKDSGGLEEMKLLPGLMPMMINTSGATWGNLNWKDAKPYILRHDGATLALSVQQEDHDGRCTGRGDWLLSYDQKIGYIWDLHARVDVLVDDKVKKWDLNVADPCFYQVLAPATSKMPACRTAPNYALYTRTDGKYGYFPANHQFRNGGGQWPELAIRRGGFFATTVDDWAAVVEVPADNAYPYYGDYCAWGLDQHVAPVMDPASPAKYTLAKKGDVYLGHARFYALPPERVKMIIAQAVLPADCPANHAELLAHEEPVNHCADIVEAVAGDSKLRWQGAYTIDHAVGRGDHCSMRVDAAEAKRKGMPVLTTMGPSFRTGPYTALKYRIGAWVKAEHFTGTVTVKVDNVVYPVKRDITIPTALLPIAGKCEWTYVGFDTPFPRLAHFWDWKLEVQGDGVVWIDDLEFSPVE